MGHVRNVRRSELDDRFWIIDNERSMISGLRYLKEVPIYAQIQRDFMETMCVFERHVVNGIRFLHEQENPLNHLTEFTNVHEPKFAILSKELDKSRQLSCFRTKNSGCAQLA